MKKAALAGIIIATLGFSGCATLNENECRTVDWQTIGFEDGTRGYSGERISQHRKACAKYGISPDLTAYQSGRSAGLREYCRPANGFRVGAAGSSYAGACPADLEAEFAEAYEAGLHLHELQSRVAETSDRIEARRDELEHAEHELARSSAAIISSDSSTERRAQALVDAKQLAEKVGRLKSDIEQLEDEEQRNQEDLEEYRSTLRYGQ